MAYIPFLHWEDDGELMLAIFQPLSAIIGLCVRLKNSLSKVTGILIALSASSLYA